MSWIDAHYGCTIHPRGEYFRAMTAHGPVLIALTDLTSATVPYRELRTRCEPAPGVEEPFLTSCREGSFRYLLIAADKVGR